MRRRTKPGCEEAFEMAMQEFIGFALSFPGNLSIHVIRSEHGHPRDYTVVDRFADRAARRAFTASDAYAHWMARLRELTEEDPHIQEMEGISGWFSLPKAAGQIPPTRWKMAVVTFLGVYPLTSLLPRWIGPCLPGWHPLAVNGVVTGLIVALLTWWVMPNLTRLFRRWLYPVIS
ncbi:hypothetical protein HNR46_001906 [Haloferula luteola]|uniref:ABM domain-containing protein n=1 Tax=Haloferula luteola TaxID=595692 RepID=A0A840UZX8_9BACT|nr:hypothetical protein [Haloferula luteola]